MLFSTCVTSFLVWNIKGEFIFFVHTVKVNDHQDILQKISLKVPQKKVGQTGWEL